MRVNIQNESEEINDFLLNCSEKFAVWGTGEVFEKIKSFYNLDIDRVEVFIETMPTKEYFYGKNVIRFSEYENMEYDTPIIIATSFVNEVTNMIIQSTLINKNVKLFNGFTLAERVGRLSNVWLTKYKDSFIDFLENGPKYINGEMTVQEDIVIYVYNWKFWISPYYCIALGILLKLKGMKVRFLLDDLSDAELKNMDREYYSKSIIGILNFVQDKWEIPYDNLRNFDSEKLTTIEIENVEESINFSKVSYTKKTSDYSNEELEITKKISENLWDISYKIKKYLQQTKPSKVFTLTGMHYSYGVLNALCESSGIKTISAELIRQGYSYSLSGPAVLQNDIPNITSLLNEYEKDELISMSEQYIKNLCFSEGEYDKKYGEFALIPLNILWDSAAYSRKDVFKNNFEDWLIDTISFLLKETELTVVVRQHPHERFYNTGQELKEKLNDHFQQTKRFIYIDCESEISSYTLINDAEIVLPNTSTIGLEAIVLGGKIVLKSNVYYANSIFYNPSVSQEQYFSEIKSALEDRDRIKKYDMNLAKIYLALTHFNRIKTKFTHHYKDMDAWINNTSLLELFDECDKNGVFELFINNKQFLYTQIKSGYLRNEIFNGEAFDHYSN